MLKLAEWEKGNAVSTEQLKLLPAQLLQRIVVAYGGDDTELLNQLNADMACECVACMRCRYLWLHNYNLTVTEVFEAINRPDLRAQMMASLQLNANTAAGDFDAFVEFLQYGELLCFAGCMFTRHLMPLQVTS